MRAMRAMRKSNARNICVECAQHMCRPPVEINNIPNRFIYILFMLLQNSMNNRRRRRRHRGRRNRRRHEHVHVEPSLSALTVYTLCTLCTCAMHIAHHAVRIAHNAARIVPIR